MINLVLIIRSKIFAVKKYVGLLIVVCTQNYIYSKIYFFVAMNENIF